MKNRIKKSILGIDIFAERGGIYIQLSMSRITPKKRRWFCRYFIDGTSTKLWGQCEASNKFTAYREAKKQCEYKTRRIR